MPRYRITAVFEADSTSVGKVRQSAETALQFMNMPDLYDPRIIEIEQERSHTTKTEQRGFAPVERTPRANRRTA